MAWVCPVCNQINDHSSMIPCACGHGITVDDQILSDMTKSNKLPVGDIVRDAFRTAGQYYSALASAVVFTLPLLIFLSFIPIYYSIQSNMLLKFLNHLAHGFIFTMLAVTCHRIVLLGKASVPRFGIYIWTMREIRFLKWYLLGYICMCLDTYFIALFKYVNISEIWHTLVQLVYFPVGYYLFARLSILLPATAIDKIDGLKWVWSITKGNGFRLIVISLIIFSSIFFLAFIFILIPVYFFIGKGIVFTLTIGTIIYIALLVDIVALSLSYRYLTK